MAITAGILEPVASLPTPPAGVAALGALGILYDDGSGHSIVQGWNGTIWVTRTLANPVTGSVPFTSLTGLPNTLALHGITSPLPVAQGGTGQTSFVAGVLHSNGTVISSSAVVDADIAAATITFAKWNQNGAATNQVPAWNGSAWVATTLSAATFGMVPDTRQIIAGAGLTGGGNLTVDRTINVGQNADGSILVNADDIQVGVLATDAQHGLRGGGTQHAAVTGSAAGFAPTITGANRVHLSTSGSNSTWGQVDLTTMVAGVLPSGNIASLAGDVTGPISTTKVVGLTGTAGNIAVHGNTLEFDAALTNLLLWQPQASAGVNGTAFNILAQSGGPGVTAGGQLNLASGGGNTIAAMQLYLGGLGSTQLISLHPSTGISFSQTFTTVKITQATRGPAGDGAIFTVQSQFAPAGTGGALDLRSGGGSDNSGEVRLFRGLNATPSINVDTSGNLLFRQGLTAAGPTLTFDSAAFLLSGCYIAQDTGIAVALGPVSGNGGPISERADTLGTVGATLGSVVDIDLADATHWPDRSTHDDCGFAISAYVTAFVTSGTGAGDFYKWEIMGSGARIAGAIIVKPFITNSDGSASLSSLSPGLGPIVFVPGSGRIAIVVGGVAGKNIRWSGWIKVHIN